MKQVVAAVSAATIGLAVISGAAWATQPCKAKTFYTELAKDACATGGQPAVKDAMKRFMAEANNRVETGPKLDATRWGGKQRFVVPKTKLTCNSCHTKLAPDYPLTADGLEKFKAYGGK